MDGHEMQWRAMKHGLDCCVCCWDTEMAGGGKRGPARRDVSASHLCILHQSHSTPGATTMALNNLLQGVRAV